MYERSGRKLGSREEVAEHGCDLPKVEGMADLLEPGHAHIAKQCACDRNVFVGHAPVGRVGLYDKHGTGKPWEEAVSLVPRIHLLALDDRAEHPGVHLAQAPRHESEPWRILRHQILRAAGPSLEVDLH